MRVPVEGGGGGCAEGMELFEDLGREGGGFGCAEGVVFVEDEGADRWGSGWW